MKRCYRKVAISRLSPLVANSRIFTLFMKGKFDAYVLWTFGQKSSKLNKQQTSLLLATLWYVIYCLRNLESKSLIAQFRWFKSSPQILATKGSKSVHRKIFHFCLAPLIFRPSHGSVYYLDVSQPLQVKSSATIYEDNVAKRAFSKVSQLQFPS